MSLTYIPKVCAYITRAGTDELLVFEGPGHENWQIPKGTIEPGESPVEAVRREVFEETGLTDIEVLGRLKTDVWDREPGEKRYIRYFFHAQAAEERDEWVHSVTGDTEERGQKFRLRWIADPTEQSFALGLDDYIDQITEPGPMHVAPAPRTDRP